MKQPKLSDLKLNMERTLEMRAAMAKMKKIKITINVDEDTLIEIRQLANKQGAPYQSLLNRLLKDSLKKKTNDESRLDKIEKELARLKKKITA